MVSASGSPRSKELGLSAAEGRLLVSTDQGRVYCFGPDGPDRQASGVPAHLTDGPLAGSADPSLSEQNTRLAKALAKITRSSAGYALLIEPPDHERCAPRETSHHRRIPRRRNAQHADWLARVGAGTRATALPVSENWTGLPEQAFNLVVVFDQSNSVERATDRLVPLLQPYNGTLVVVTPSSDRSLEGRGVSDQRVAEGGGAASWSTVVTDDFVLRVYRARPPQGFGEWSHPYADAGNTPAAEDRSRT
jgi:hypothetical protein